MDEEKKIPTEKMFDILQENFPADSVIDFHGQELIVRHLIPYIVVCDMAREIADACFAKESGEYLPEVLKFAIRVAVVGAYTNVELPDNPEYQYRILFGTDLWETVFREISQTQYYELYDAIVERIKCRNDMNRKFFENEIKDALDAVTKFSDNIASLFGGVTTEDIQNLVDAIGNGGIDEEELVKAVVHHQNEMRNDSAAEEEPVTLEVVDGSQEGAEEE